MAKHGNEKDTPATIQFYTDEKRGHPVYQWSSAFRFIPNQLLECIELGVKHGIFNPTAFEEIPISSVGAFYRWWWEQAEKEKSHYMAKIAKLVGRNKGGLTVAMDGGESKALHSKIFAVILYIEGSAYPLPPVYHHDSDTSSSVLTALETAMSEVGAALEDIFRVVVDCHICNIQSMQVLEDLQLLSKNDATEPNPATEEGEDQSAPGEYYWYTGEEDTDKQESVLMFKIADQLRKTGKNLRIITGCLEHMIKNVIRHDLRKIDSYQAHFAHADKIVLWFSQQFYNHPTRKLRWEDMLNNAHEHRDERQLPNDACNAEFLLHCCSVLPLRDLKLQFEDAKRPCPTTEAELEETVAALQQQIETSKKQVGKKGAKWAEHTKAVPSSSKKYVYHEYLSYVHSLVKLRDIQKFADSEYSLMESRSAAARDKTSVAKIRNHLKNNYAITETQLDNFQTIIKPLVKLLEQFGDPANVREGAAFKVAKAIDNWDSEMCELKKSMPAQSDFIEHAIEAFNRRFGYEENAKDFWYAVPWFAPSIAGPMLSVKKIPPSVPGLAAVNISIEGPEWARYLEALKGDIIRDDDFFFEQHKNVPDVEKMHRALKWYPTNVLAVDSLFSAENYVMNVRRGKMEPSHAALQTFVYANCEYRGAYSGRLRQEEKLKKNRDHQAALKRKRGKRKKRVAEADVGEEAGDENQNGIPDSAQLSVQQAAQVAEVMEKEKVSRQEAIDQVLATSRSLKDAYKRHPVVPGG